MTIIILVLMVLACACLLLQAAQVNVKRLEIGWLGLFFWCLAVTLPILGHIGQVAVILIVVLIALIVIVAVDRRPAPKGKFSPATRKQANFARNFGGKK